MPEVQVQQAPSEMQRLDHETALSIARSLHSDLDLGVVVKRLYTFVSALTRVSHLHYSNQQPDITYELGEQQSHSLTYELKLTSQPSSAGTVILSAQAPLSDHDTELVAELLSLAANALMNAHKYLAAITPGQPVTPHPKPEKPARKCPDALVLVRIEGLDIIRDLSSEALADSIMSELKVQLSQTLREADGTHKVDNDHLAVLLPSTATGGAERVAEKVARLVDELDFIDPLLRRELSVSVGISSTSDASSAEDVLANAKVQLAKALRNQPPQTVH